MQINNIIRTSCSFTFPETIFECYHHTQSFLFSCPEVGVANESSHYNDIRTLSKYHQCSIFLLSTMCSYVFLDSLGLPHFWPSEFFEDCFLLGKSRQHDFQSKQTALFVFVIMNTSQCHQCNSVAFCCVFVIVFGQKWSSVSQDQDIQYETLEPHTIASQQDLIHCCFRPFCGIYKFVFVRS